MTIGLRRTSGAGAAPPYSKGPYTWDQDVTFSGTITFSGSMTFGDAAVDTLTVNGDADFNASVDIGTYSNKQTAASGTTTELVSIGLEGAEDDFYIGAGCYVRATGEDGKPFGWTSTIETTNTTGINKMQAGQ